MISSPYFAKLGAQDGEPLWAVNLAFPGVSLPKFLAMDKEGNLYFAADIQYSSPVAIGGSIPVLEDGDFFTDLIRYASADLLLGMISGPKGNDGQLSWLKSYSGSKVEAIAGLQLDKGQKKLWILANSNSPS